MGGYLGVSRISLVGVVLVQKQGSREQHLSITFSSQMEIWYCDKNVKTTSREQNPWLIDLLGPVTVLKRAKHDFCSP
jgi:hypothetical protein